jgi:hypothetical protein
VGELVPLGVASEVVVVIEDEDTSVVSHGLAVEVGGRETGDASSHNDEVVALVRVEPVLPHLSVTHRMRDLPRAVVASPKAGRGRGVAIRSEESHRPSHGAREKAPAYGDPDPVQEVAARNGAVHAEVAIAPIHIASQAPGSC